MRRGRAGGLAAGGFLCLAAACGGDPVPGRLVGDAFLAQNIDQQVNLAGMPVHLLSTVEELDSMLAPLCPPRGPGDTPAPPAAWDAAWRRRSGLLTPLRLRSAVTDARAQFAMDTVAPGRYLVWADTMLGGKRWAWLLPIRIEDGDTLRVNLTNDNSEENPLRCRARRDE
jgi:hypothetical protein